MSVFTSLVAIVMRGLPSAGHNRSVVGTVAARRGSCHPFPANAGMGMVRPRMQLLVIEDDREAAAYIAKGLSESGYVVDHAAEGRTGLFMATSGNYDALIVDRMLPGVDGLALIAALRAAEIRTPVLILSALGAVDDRVKGLRAGSDDYLVKPFAFAELLARIEALLRRPASKWAISTWTCWPARRSAAGRRSSCCRGNSASSNS